MKRPDYGSAIIVAFDIDRLGLPLTFSPTLTRFLAYFAGRSVRIVIVSLVRLLSEQEGPCAVAVGTQRATSFQRPRASMFSV